MRTCPAGLTAAALSAALATLAIQPAAAGPGNPSPASVGDQGIPGVRSTHASSTSLKPGELVLGFSGRGHRYPFQRPPESGPGAGSPSNEPLFLSTRVFLAGGLGHGLDLALSLPFYYESRSEDPARLARARGQGDLAITLKALAPWPSRYLSFSLVASGTFAVASKEGGFPRELIHHPPESAYPSATALPFGTLDSRLGGGAGATLSLGGREDPPFRLHLNLTGERVMAPDLTPSLGVMKAFAAIEAPLGAGWKAEGEVKREILVKDPLDWSAGIGESAVFALGLSWSPAPWISIRAGGELGPEELNPAIPLKGAGASGEYRGAPPAAGHLGLALRGSPLQWDRDVDGIPDRRDRCPRRSEDKDGYEDEDGCPDFDNDRDGAADSLDLCPAAHEDRDGFKDEDGCPDPDNDLDGVEDALDACRNEAEDKDGSEDTDGCPEMDDDRDGIPDAADRCPKDAENRNGFEDADGCPEPDLDGDALPDRQDRCPREAEIVNFFQDGDGCPDEKPRPVQSGPLPGVQFLSGTAVLLPSSFRALDSLAWLLSVYPGTEIEIQGHLDDRSGTGAAELSRERAGTVAAYLSGKGVEARRMKPVGYGASRPTASNRTAAGREANRRLEIRRLN